MKLIYHNIYQSKETEITIESSNNTSITSNNITELLWYLTSPDYNDSQPALNIVWDLDASVASLCKLLTPKQLKYLGEKSKCYIAPYNIFYSKNKVFSVKPVTSGSYATSLYSLNQYFPDVILPSPPSIVSLSLIQQYGEKLLEALSIMNLEPKKLSSPVAIYDNCIMQYMNLPDIYDIPKEVARYAFECSGKLWTEAYKIGYWEEAFDYDIESSFPTAIKNQIDIRYGNWYETNKLERIAYYSFYHCKATIYDNIKVHPIIFVEEDGSLSTRNGTRETHLMGKEIKRIYEHNIGEVEIYNGHYFVPNRFIYPFEQHMTDLLKYKKYNNKVVNDLAKRMSVGIYGKFGEEYEDRFGKYCNPVWFADISTTVRLEVDNFIYNSKLEDNLIHVSVDGILLDKEVNLC